MHRERSRIDAEPVQVEPVADVAEHLGNEVTHGSLRPPFRRREAPRGFQPISLRYNPAPDRILLRDGTIKYRRSDGKLVDHPTLQGLHFINLKLSWEVTGIERYRRTAIAQARHMRSHLVEHRGALWATYDIPLRHQKEKLPQPWVSAFGQQRMMGVAMAMHTMTGDDSWLDVAQKVFRAFALPRDPSRPGLWVTAKDASGYLWFEGFPRASGVPTLTYNIHLSALYGVAAMYSAPLGDDHADLVRDLVHAGTATAAHYAPSVRNRQQCSFYYGNPRRDPMTSKFYHGANVGAMWTVYDRTGYAPLAAWATALTSDFPVTTDGGRVFIKAGTYYLRKIWANDHDDGKVWKVTFKRNVWRGVDRREGARAGGAAANRHQRAWLRLTGQPYNGWWIHEEPGKVFLEGFDVDRLNFHNRPVEIHFRPGKRITGVSRHANGWERARTAVRATFKKTGRARADTISRVQGRLEARIIDGPFAGKWVPLGKDVYVAPRYLG